MEFKNFISGSGKSWNLIILLMLESHGKLNFCLIDYLLRMTRPGRCKIKRGIVKQGKQHVPW